MVGWICKDEGFDFDCKMRTLCQGGADIRVVDRDGLVQKVHCCMIEVNAHLTECSQVVWGKFENFRERVNDELKLNRLGTAYIIIASYMHLLVNAVWSRGTCHR
jgi:hypothetical protein